MQSRDDDAERLARWCALPPSDKVEVEGSRIKVLQAIQALLNSDPVLVNSGTPAPLEVAVAQPKSHANKPLIKCLLHHGANVTDAVRDAVHKERDEVVAILNGKDSARPASEAVVFLDLLRAECSKAPQSYTSLPEFLGGGQIKVLAAVEKILSCDAWKRALSSGSVAAAEEAGPQLPTPLEVAVAQPTSHANKPLIKCLLDHGANVTSAVRAAVREGRDEVVEMLDRAQTVAAKKKELRDSAARARDSAARLRELEDQEDQRRQGTLSTKGCACHRQSPAPTFCYLLCFLRLFAHVCCCSSCWWQPYRALLPVVQPRAARSTWGTRRVPDRHGCRQYSKWCTRFA